jgi:MFS transporter, DHA2 family, methylenomycin A resistance protein
MLPLSLFRSQPPVAPTGSRLRHHGVLQGMVQRSPLFKKLRGRSALWTGLLFLPMTGMVAATNPVIAPLIERFGRGLPINRLFSRLG